MGKKSLIPLFAFCAFAWVSVPFGAFGASGVCKIFS